MGSTYPNHLRLAIAKAAEEIPFELMMAIAPDAARKLLAPYRNLDISEVEVLAALVTAVIVRREVPPIADGPPRQERKKGHQKTLGRRQGPPRQRAL
jgi:hypothetical protein